MAILPTGRMGRAIHTVRDALIACPAWTAWCLGDAVQAAADAYLVAAPERIKRAHALIDLDPNTFQRTRDGVTIGPFVHRGAVMLYLSGPVSAGITDNDNDAATEFMNRADAVLDEFESQPSLAGPSSGLVLNGISLAGGPTRTEKQHRDKGLDMVEAMFLLDMTEWP